MLLSNLAYTFLDDDRNFQFPYKGIVYTIPFNDLLEYSQSKYGYSSIEMRDLEDYVIEKLDWSDIRLGNQIYNTIVKKD